MEILKTEKANKKKHMRCFSWSYSLPVSTGGRVELPKNKTKRSTIGHSHITSTFKGGKVGGFGI